MIHFDLPKEKSSIIKVIGIGGGGNNAVNHMYSQDIQGVDFIICNTDSQAIANSAVPNKVQLGPHLTQGLGAGANPQIGKQATEESFEEIKKMLEVNTKMAFITAGMGGGTGTGGAPIIASICKELDILTVGIVTTPFSYEGKRRMQQADEGISNLKEHVDTLLIISNDKLRQQFGNLPFKAAFAKADNILATAAKCITDVINIHGLVNVDFADVCTAMRDGGVAILGSAAADGENRAQKAIEDALASPLLNDNSIMGAKWILLNITSAEGEFEHTIDEMDIIQAYVRQQAGEDCDVILGMGYDNTLSNKLGVTIIATGFEQKPIALQKKKPEAPKEEPKIVMELGKVDEEKKMYNQTAIEFVPEDEMAPRLTEPAQTESAHAEPQPAEPQPPQPEPQHQQPAQPPQPEPQHREPPRPTPSAVQLEIPPAAEEPPMRLTLKQEDVHGQEEEKKENTEPSQPSFAGGYLSRPTHIYAEPDTPGKAAPQTPPEKEQPDMKLVIKDEQAAGSQADTEGSLEETEEQKRKAAERIARLRDMSFNVKNMENPHELETIPAYIRRNISLPDNNSSAEDPSGYTVTQREDGRRAEISTINTFLEGKKPD